MENGYTALIGAIIGFLAALVPELIGMWKDHVQHKRSMREKEQELEAATAGYEFVIMSQNDVIEEQAAQIEQLFLMQQDMKEASSSPVMQVLRSSVRPLLTYAFFGLFAVIKLYALVQAVHQGMSVIDVLPVLWDEDTEGLFAAVISFWFGSRATGLRSTKLRQRQVTDGLRGRNASGPVYSGDEA